MSRISIVGVDGSGKTVLMSAFGEKYERPDGYGYFLSANTPQTFHTVKMLMDRMRHGQWPNATGAETVTNLEWSLMQRKGDGNEKICSVSFLDYAGEIYRLAFGEHSEDECKPFMAQIKMLHQHVSSSDVLLVLVNLKDIVSGDLGTAKTREMLWISRNIFDYASQKHPGIKMALAFSQFDIYRAEIASAGGMQAVYKKYLSHIESLYPEMQLLAVSAVNRTTVNDEGYEVPAKDFGSEGLDTLLEWIVSTVPGHEGEIEYRRNLPTRLWRELIDGRESLASGAVALNAERLHLLDRLVDCAEEFRQLPEAERCSVADDGMTSALSRYLAEEVRRVRGFEKVLFAARENGIEAAEVVLEDVAEQENCSREDLNRIRAEMADVAETAKITDRKARFCKRMSVAVITVLISAAAVVGVLKGKKYIEAELERRCIAEQKEFERKENAGYMIELVQNKKTARWEEGRVPPANSNLITAAKCEEYRAVRAGYEWIPGTLMDTWKPGLKFPGAKDVVAGESEGMWVSTKPGYAVDENCKLVWREGLKHSQNCRLVSSVAEGMWTCSEVGYKWDGGTGVVWQVGVRHSNDWKLVSSGKEGCWESTEPGYVWDGKRRAVWKAGLRHPLNDNLVSAESECQWRSRRGGGWVWDGGIGEKWQAGIKLAAYPHWVTVEKENHARPEPGYKKKDENAPGWCELVWNPGMTDYSNGVMRKASSIEGRWLSQVDCSICNGTGNKSGYVECWRCDGAGNVDGEVTCSSCGGNGHVNGSVSCPNCKGNGSAYFRCTNIAHNMHCAACHGRRVVNFGMGWMPCAGCRGSGRMLCYLCNNTGSSLQMCNNCSGSGRVQSSISCSSCGGRGRVSGKITCSRCDGKRQVSGKVTCTYCGRDGCEKGKVWERE